MCVWLRSLGRVVGVEAGVARLAVRLLVLLAWVWLTPSLASAQTAARPNLLVILTDDQGLGEYSAFGTRDLRTPAIDRLMREGARFDNFFANSCVCSPTRAALLTGCYPDRVGVPGVIRDLPDNSWGKLSERAELLPRRLKTVGYHSAIVGKWHLGYAPPDTPNDRGFDFFHGFLGDMMDDYWTHLRNGKNFLRRNNEPIAPTGHATDLFSTWACDYLRERAKHPEPWFLYLAFNAPHDPLQPPPEWLEKVKAREPGIDDKRARLVALIEHMDEGLGRVLQTLDETDQSGRTLVVFTSDNGGVLDYGARNGPWRSGKQHMYEGGLRVPCAVRWPGRTKPDSRIAAPALTMDLFPTLLEAAGAAAPAEIDGLSLVQLLDGRATTLPERDHYFVRREGGPAYGGKTIEALRRGRWKLLQDSPFGPLELYDLAADPAEASNLAAREKAVVRDLSAALRKHIQRGGATPWQPLPTSTATP